VLAVRRAPGELMGGLWELPWAERRRGETSAEALRRVLLERLGLEVHQLERVGVVEHLFSHRSLRLHLFRCDRPRGRVRRRGFVSHRWITPEEFASLPHGAATRKALALLSD